MVAIFVHGVPDTERVWHRVLERLARQDVLTLSLPGFGGPVPEGFSCTKEAYVEWLIKALEAQPSPVDLVGHDWGALLTLRAVSLRPDLVRSWAYGSAPMDPDYVWHRAARAWQTRGIGELLMAITPRAMLRRELRVGGVPDEDAAHAASSFDRTMRGCILRLYRSAVHIGAEWSGELTGISAPGLIFWGQDDPYAPATFGEKIARRTGARMVVYPGCGHWWALQEPEEVAAELERFWASI